MGNGSQVTVTLSADTGIADFVFTITGIEPEFMSDFQCFIQCLFGSASERCSVFSKFFHTIDGNKTGNIAEELLLIGFNEIINFCHYFCFHGNLL